jgi:hypothetical protein
VLASSVCVALALASPLVGVAHAADPAEKDKLESVGLRDEAVKNRVTQIWTIGDSTAQPIGQGIERNVNDQAGFHASTYFRNSSGLARREFYDWPKVASDLLRVTAPDIAIITLGANDTQGLFPPGKRYPVMPGTAEWRAEYERRVEAFVGLFTSKGTRVYLLLQPYNPHKKYAEMMADVNTVLTTVGKRLPRVTVVDGPALLADDSGNYSNIAQDSKGRKITLRAEDGLHLTGNGGGYFAKRILRAMEHDKLVPPNTSGLPALPADVAQHPGSTPSPSASLGSAQRSGQ